MRNWKHGELALPMDALRFDSSGLLGEFASLRHKVRKA